MIAVEVALKLNNPDDVKALLHENFYSATELEDLLSK